MIRPPRTSSSLFAAALATFVALLAVGATGAGADTTVSPLPSSNYEVRASCANPRPGRANCLALQLVPKSLEAQLHTHPLGMERSADRAHPAVPSPKTGELGLRPQDLHTVYALPTTAPGEPPTIALIDAYNDPTAEADLAKYDEEFSLPACTKENGCFNQVGQSAGGSVPFPKSLIELETALANPTTEEEAEEAIGWGTEISLDIESAHATCQSCHILLVEANSPETSDLTAAESRAEELHASEISNSWGSPEEGVSSSAAETLPFNDPRTVITASAGDDGYRNWAAKRPVERGFTSFPASSPSVVAVGGTRLAPLGTGGEWTGESVWNGSGAGGGGCSVVFTAASWQQQAQDWSSVGCGSKRAVADVAADADPYSGIVIYDSDDSGSECATPYREHKGEEIKYLANWCTYGGTSLASPIVASVFALAGGANGVRYPAQTLYETRRDAPNELHDVTSGSNGECASGYSKETGVANCSSAEEAAKSCKSTLICLAAPGYDGPSGVGTPDGILGFTPDQLEGEAPSTTPAVATPTPPPAPPPAPVVVPTTVQLSSLGLTTPAVLALNRHPTTAKVAFAFDSNMAAKVKVALARQVRVHHRVRWVPVSRTATIAIAAGRNVRRLPGGKRLGAGLYRLTITPSTGKPRSVLFHIG